MKGDRLQWINPYKKEGCFSITVSLLLVNQCRDLFCKHQIEKIRNFGLGFYLVGAQEVSMQIKFNICFYCSQALVILTSNVPPFSQNSLMAPSSKHVVYVHMSWLSCEFRLQHYHNNVLHLLVLSFSCKIHNKSNLSYKKGLGLDISN